MRYVPGHWFQCVFSLSAIWTLNGACGGADSGTLRGRGSDGAAGAASPTVRSVSSTSADNPTSLVVSTGPATSGGSCKPGHYVGTFNGMYRSAAWGNGALPLVVASSDSPDMPGLEFWLQQTGATCAPGNEFCADLTVSGGKMRGFANPFSTDDPNAPANDPSNPLSAFALRVPFTIDLNGALDCTRGQLMLTLDNGQYDVATVLFHFAGTAVGDYKHATAAVVNGKWTVAEIQNPDAIWPPDASIGGEGVWDAHLEP